MAGALPCGACGEQGPEQEPKMQALPGTATGKWESVQKPKQSPEVLLEPKEIGFC